MSRLRSYKPMKRQSDKVAAAEAAYQAVYRIVDQRSGGRCEFWQPVENENDVPVQCPRRATDHHHIEKPRRSHHTPDLIVHLCRVHHDRCEWPYKRGRLIVTILGWPDEYFSFAIRFASDKLAARRACSCLPTFHLHTPDGANRCTICGCVSPPVYL